MSRFQRRKKASKYKNLLGGFLILCIFLLVIMLAFFQYYLQAEQVKVDPVTLCPIEKESTKYVALIFDKSDPYNPVQQQFLKRFFSRFKNNLVAGTQISVYLIDGLVRDKISANLVVCAPRTGSDANAIYENPRLIKQRWQQHFEQPLDKVINDFIQTSNAKFSPIMEMLQVVSLSAFPVNSDSAEKKIILISDMLHNMPDWSHYRGQMDFKTLQKTKYYQRINTELHNVDVNILYVRREGMEKIQNKKHAFFWADYIESMGGRVSLIEKIDG